MKKSPAILTLLLAGSVAACGSDTQRGEPAVEDRARAAADAARDAARDVGRAAEGAAETVDVKAALMLENDLDASDINVDTNGADKVVSLKGSVPTEAQRLRAEQIAAREAAGYRVDNQLIVRAR